jgi:hypothetical protein
MSRNSCTKTLILILIITSGCKPRGDIVEGDVVERKPSPDSTVVALITRANYGATVPYVYRVYLQPSDPSAAAKQLLQADKMEDMHVDWEQNGTLLIRMPCGRIFAFTNFLYVLGKDGKLVTRIPVKLDTGGLCDPMNPMA